MSDLTCENCGFAEAGLVRVHRVYVVPESWDRPGSETVVDGTEMWCVSCVSQYPCDIVGPAPGDR